jgi:hypothetical protein
MKNMTRGISLLLAMVAISGVHAGQPAPGVAGVEVFAKQNPGKRAVTDAHGSFALEGLAPGSYTVTFRSRPAKDTKTPAKTTMMVASTYAIKLQVGTQSVNQGGFSGARLERGVDFPVQLGTDAKIRGQVLGVGYKKMIWIAAEVGSHMSGHWVEADSKEAARFNTNRVSGDDLRKNLQMAPDPHQEGFQGGDSMSKLSGISSPGK